MRYVVQFSRYLTTVGRLHRDENFYTFYACAGARRNVIEGRFTSLELPRRAHELVQLPPTPGSIRYRVTQEGRHYFVEVRGDDRETEHLAVVGLYADSYRDFYGVGVATAREGRLELAPHPAVRDVITTSSGGGQGVLLFASLAPHHPPLAVRIHNLVYLLHPLPQPRVEELTAAELLSTLADQSFVEL